MRRQLARPFYQERRAAEPPVHINLENENYRMKWQFTRAQLAVLGIEVGMKIPPIGKTPEARVVALNLYENRVKVRIPSDKRETEMPIDALVELVVENVAFPILKFINTDWSVWQ